MDILQVETTRKLLEERKNVATTACLEEERRLERLKAEIASLEGVLKLKTSSSSSLDDQISAQNTVLLALKKEIRETVADKDAIIHRKTEEIAWEEENHKVALAHRDGINKDILQAQFAFNQIQTEVGEKKEELKQQGELLVSLLHSIAQEQTKLDTLISSQVQERLSLATEKKLLSDTAKQQEQKEKELYGLREDLTIIRDRYASFAREHSLPFNA